MERPSALRPSSWRLDLCRVDADAADQPVLGDRRVDDEVEQPPADGSGDLADGRAEEIGEAAERLTFGDLVAELDGGLEEPGGGGDDIGGAREAPRRRHRAGAA